VVRNIGLKRWAHAFKTFWCRSSLFFDLKKLYASIRIILLFTTIPESETTPTPWSIAEKGWLKINRPKYTPAVLISTAVNMIKLW
jgi:hypothetical protein